MSSRKENENLHSPRVDESNFRRFAVDLTPLTPLGDDPRRRQQLFHQSLSLGLSVFDLTTSPTPQLDARLLQSSNLEFRRSLTVIIPSRPPRTQGMERIPRNDTGGLSPSRRASTEPLAFLEELREVVGDSGRIWVESGVDEAEEHPSQIGLSASFDEESKSSSVTRVIRWESPEQLNRALEEARRLPGAMVSGPASLLDVRGPWEAAARAKGREQVYLARDPFAGGRLSGSILEGGNLVRNPAEGPRSIEQLQNEYRPVLAFGFLAKRGVRNLRVASLQFLMTLTVVAGVVVPASNVRQLEELQRLPQAPPLEEAELEQIARIHAGIRTR